MSYDEYERAEWDSDRLAAECARLRAAMPVVPGEGDTYRDASTGTEYRYTGGAWVHDG